MATAKKTTKKATPKKVTTKKAVPKKAKAPAFDANLDVSAKEGQFAEVVVGEHKGRYGVVEIIHWNKGVPTTALVRTRDDQNELLHVDYAHLRPAESGRR